MLFFLMKLTVDFIQQQFLSTLRSKYKLDPDIKETYSQMEPSIITKFNDFRKEQQNVSNTFKIELDGIDIEGIIETKAEELRSRLESILDQHYSNTK